MDPLKALELFEAVVALPAAERDAFLTAACGDDAQLHAEVVSLLRHDPGEGAATQDLPALGTGFHVLRAVAVADRPLHELPVRLGRYLVQQELGAGAMGVVYRAEQDQPRRPVALKLMSARLDTEADRARFAVEAQALALLRHPGIAQVYDSGTLPVRDRDVPFLAMELVEGMPLLRWVAECAPDLATRIALVAALAQAVDAAHRSGVIHRDLKPDNVLVEEDAGQPRARILDFGVARILAQVRSEGDPAQDIAGTRAYMSPEQAAGEAVDVRTDVWSLGVIAWQVLTGALPFALDGLDALAARAVLAQPVPLRLSAQDRRLRGDLELVVTHALAFTREQRYASAGEFAADLMKVLEHRPVSIRPARAGYDLQCFARRQRVACASLLVAALALVLALVIGWTGYLETRSQLDLLVDSTRVAVESLIGQLSSQAGTSRVFAPALDHYLTQAEALVRLRPDDARVLEVLDQVLQRLGDLAINTEQWAAARNYRRRSLSARVRLLALNPADPEQDAEVATARVRVGDAEQRPGGPGRATAREWYQQAHAIFVRLASQDPYDARRVDALAWSCDRNAYLDMEDGLLASAEQLLVERARHLERLRLLAPDSVMVLAGERSLWCLRSRLERKRAHLDAARDCVHHSIAPARARCRLEPNGVPAMVEFVSSVLSYLGLAYETGAAPSSERPQLMAEASAMLDRLLTLEPEHREGLSMRAELERQQGYLTGGTPR